jgi:hypothetical protein
MREHNVSAGSWHERNGLSYSVQTPESLSDNKVNFTRGRGSE